MIFENLQIGISMVSNHWLLLVVIIHFQKNMSKYHNFTTKEKECFFVYSSTSICWFSWHNEQWQLLLILYNIIVSPYFQNHKLLPSTKTFENIFWWVTNNDKGPKNDNFLSMLCIHWRKPKFIMTLQKFELSFNSTILLFLLK